MGQNLSERDYILINKGMSQPNCQSAHAVTCYSRFIAIKASLIRHPNVI